MKNEKIVKEMDKRGDNPMTLECTLPMPDTWQEFVSLFESGEAAAFAIVQDRLRVLYRSRMEGLAARKEKPVRKADQLAHEITGGKKTGFMGYNPQGAEGDPVAKATRKATKLAAGMSPDEIAAAIAELQAQARKGKK